METLTAGQTLLTASNLTKSYGELTAVDDISFEIAEGEAFGLLGPNGAGKTTTISMLIGLLKPDVGSIEIGKFGSPHSADVRRHLGIAPQKLSLYEELTAKENLAFLAKLYQVPGGSIGERVAWCLNFAGLTDRGNDRVSTYSGGMQRRLNLACALIHEPKLILLDEPTVGVDPQSRNHLLERIEELKKNGLTILFTTHYMEEAQRLCDRVAVMDEGKLLAIDNTSTLLSKFGGQSVVVAQVASLPDANVELPGQLDGLDLRFESSDPFREISQLNSRGIEFTNLQIKQPDLEAVFLNLTGRSLRD